MLPENAEAKLFDRLRSATGTDKAPTGKQVRQVTRGRCGVRRTGSGD